MTVGELIALLEEFPPELPVFFSSDDTGRVAVAPRDKWFADYWSNVWDRTPEFAFTVDIHRKPGYDPCELWFDWRRMARTFKIATATNPSLVKASHGRVDDDPRDWAVLLTYENLPAQVSATDVAPLVRRLLAS